MLNADDSLDVFGVHGIGGVVGALMTGLFASKTISGVHGDIVVQLMGVVAVVVYSGVMSAALLWFTKLLVGLRVDDGSELTGLDVTQHREHMGT
jgi:Amt family ammonium transporter